MDNRGQTRGPVLLPGIIAIGVVVTTVAVGGAAVDSVDQEALSHEIEKAQAYCNQTYGSPNLTNSRVMGSHGGFHCTAADGDEPHLHDVTDEAKQAALEAERNGEKVDWSEVDRRYKPPHQRADSMDFKLYGGFALATLLVAGVIVYFNRRGGDE